MKLVELIVWEVVIELQQSFRMDNRGGNGAGCFEVKVWVDTAKFTKI